MKKEQKVIYYQDELENTNPLMLENIKMVFVKVRANSLTKMVVQKLVHLLMVS